MLAKAFTFADVHVILSVALSVRVLCNQSILYGITAKLTVGIPPADEAAGAGDAAGDAAAAGLQRSETSFGCMHLPSAKLFGSSDFSV
jgi:hypothetical protein